jgi:hypothetical protein
MFYPFKANTNLDPKFTPRTRIQPKVPTPNGDSFTIIKNATHELKRLTNNEKSLLKEKRQLVRLIEELEYMVSVEVETKQKVITQLKDEIPELQNKCEKIANALEIPVIK